MNNLHPTPQATRPLRHSFTPRPKRPAPEITFEQGILTQVRGIVRRPYNLGNHAGELRTLANLCGVMGRPALAKRVRSLAQLLSEPHVYEIPRCDAGMDLQVRAVLPPARLED